MEASDEAREYVNVTQGEKKASAVDTLMSSFRTYRLVAVSFGVLCVLQVTLNVTLRLNANTKSDVQTNISLLIEENNQLLNNYTELLLENEELQEKLENVMWKLSKICIDGNTHNSFNTKNPELPNNLVNNLLQDLADARRELRVEIKSTGRWKYLEVIFSRLQTDVHQLRAIIC